MNSQRTIAIVSPFALQEKEDVEFSALASYTKALVKTFPNEIKERIVILAQLEPFESSYEFEDILVERVWRKESFLYFLHIFSYCRKNKIETVHIQHEIYGYGTHFTPYISPFMMPLLILLLRMHGVRVVTTIHGVVNPSSMSHDFVRRNKVRGGLIFIKLGLAVIFKMLVGLSSRVIVHNSNIKQTLVNKYKVSEKKITVISLPLYEYSGEKRTAKIFNKEKIRGKKIILFFGYLADYKGLDTFIDTFNHFNLEKNNSVALIAGSVPKRLENDENHNDWLNELEARSKEISPNIIWQKKFISDDKLENYFTNAFIVVIPYKHALSASGPLAHAIKQKKPTLVSSVFKGVVENELIYGRDSVDLAYSLNKYYNSHAFRKLIEDAVEKQHSLWNNTAIGILTCGLYEYS